MAAVRAEGMEVVDPFYSTNLCTNDITLVLQVVIVQKFSERSGLENACSRTALSSHIKRGHYWIALAHAARMSGFSTSTVYNFGSGWSLLCMSTWFLKVHIVYSLINAVEVFETCIFS